MKKQHHYHIGMTVMIHLKMNYYTCIYKYSHAFIHNASTPNPHAFIHNISVPASTICQYLYRIQGLLRLLSLIQLINDSFFFIDLHNTINLDMYDNTINLDKILLSPLKKHSTKTNTKSNNKNYKHKLLNNGKNGKNNNKSITNNRISTNNDKRITNMKINNNNNYIIITINGDLSDGATVECTGNKSDGAQIHGEYIKEFKCDQDRACANGEFSLSYINDTKECTIYRSIFHAALPIATNINKINGKHESKYKNAEDRKDEQELIYGEWAQELWTEITVNTNGQHKDGNLQILALSYVVFVEYLIGLLSEAMFYVLFAIMAVYIYMTIHLRSFILSFAALIQILMSFPLAFFFYRLLFQITHFDTFSSLIIFVLLGVGADDVFVFTDAWYQSVNFINNKNKENILLERMSFAYSRASKAMFITQITTFFAFMATATSLIMPISAFGIWAGTIVACNYMLVITMYPCILILHEKYLKKYEQMICCCICNVFKSSRNQNTNEDNNEDNNTKDNNYRSIEIFFGGKFTDFILKFRAFILIIFLIIYGLCSFAATQIEPNKGDEVWFEDDHFMQVVADSANEFTAGETDGLFNVWVVWGVSGVNRDGTNKWDSTDYGIVEWDNTFDMSSINAQLFIKDICDDLKENHLSFSKDVVTCFIDYFEFYLNSINMTYPILLSDNNKQQKLLFAELMYEFLHESDYGEYIRNYGLVYVEKEINNNNNNEYEIKFIAIQVLSDTSWDSTNDEIIDEFNKWNEWMDDIKDNCGGEEEETYCSPYHSSWAWADFAIKDAFVNSAIQGVIIAMPLSFIILLISTQNWIISIFAVLDIIGIMLCELGLMATMGWQFGISEAISTVMIIGFSVDYVVHLANAYLECSHEYDLRSDRLRFALLTMAISVVSGAITTFSAGFFLIFPVILFFYKMGILMMSTIAFSILFAMFFFTSLLAQFGPQYNSGNICCCCLKKNKNENENENDDIEMQ